jgi:hypothetical protein
MPITCEASTSTNSAAFQQSSTSTELFAEIPLSTNGHEPHQQKLSYIGGCDLTTICEGEAYPIHHHSIVVDHDGRDYDDNSVLFRPLENKAIKFYVSFIK